MHNTVSPSASVRSVHAAFACAIASFTACITGIAAPGGVADTTAGTYTLDYDTDYTVNADDATAAEGLAIVKKGSGTVTAGADLASFAGEIRIEEGIWFVNDLGGLGTGAGGTVVSNGAALHFNYSGQNKLKFAAGESLTIVGTGPDGKGALYNASAGATSPYEQSQLLSAGNCKFELSGNATVGGNYNFGLGGGTVRLNGHRLTLKMKNVAPFNITCDAIETAGDIRIEKGRLFFRSGTEWGGGETNVIHAVSSDSQVAFNSVVNPIPYKLIMEEGSRLYPSSPKPFSTKYNIWSGPIVLNGSISLAYSSSEATGVTLSGPVSGSGGITVSSISKLCLSCPTNVFTGALTVKSGAVLYVAENGAVPANGGGINGEDGATVVLSGGDMSLPVSTFAGCLVSNAVVGAKATFASVTKTGAGTLNLVGGIEAANIDVQEGDVKFGRIVPVGEYAGLYSYSTNFVDQADMLAWWPASTGPNHKNSTAADWLAAANKLKGEVEPELVDYPVFAYSAWANKYQLYVAEGCFRSNEPTNAVFTFTTSIADMAAVWIDGTCILRRGSSSNIPVELRSSDNVSTHFISSGTLTLGPGPHQFLFVSGRYASSGRGPRAQKLGGAGLDWAANFGIGWRLGKDEPDENYPDALLGVVVHSSNYTAVSNTADAVVITPGAYYTAAEVAAKPGRYAPTFLSATFANGTALDLGDVAPYCGAAAIGNLTGTPTVANGLLSLSGLWTPTAEGLAVQPLTLDAAELSFGDGAAVSHPVRPAGAVRVAYAPDGSSITNAPSLAEGMAGLYRRCSVQDGGEGATALDLLPFIGLRIGIR